jgi:hypothetical protein
MDKMFDARCHWGKYCPIDADRVRSNYPELENFLHVARTFDAQGQFSNGWLASIIPASVADVPLQKGV